MDTPQTRVISVDPANPEPAVIEQAAAMLRAGGLVAFPTETVYGLGARALDAAAVTRVFRAKGRPASDPLIVHICAPEQLDLIASNVPEQARMLMARFWPGPLTLVLRRHARVPSAVAAGGSTVAVRIPNHPVALALIAAAGPLVGPSANRFSRPSPTTAAHVLEDLRDQVEIILDAGPTEIGVESTVVDITSQPPMILRPGGVALEALREALPDLGYTPRYLEVIEGGAAPAPGMLLRHYAPRAALTLYSGNSAAARLVLDAASLPSGTRLGVLVPNEETTALADVQAHVLTLGPRDEPERIAARLFAALRELDAAGVDIIFAIAPPREGLGLAIWDRLVRAAEGRVKLT
jgi:L-threonylcarbamoyladenylate synthase